MSVSSISQVPSNSPSFNEAHADQMVETTWAMIKSMLLGVVLFLLSLELMGRDYNGWALSFFLTGSFGAWLLYQQRWYVIARYFAFTGASLGCLMIVGAFGIESYSYFLLGPLILSAVSVFKSAAERLGLSLLILLCVYLLLWTEVNFTFIETIEDKENYRIIFILLTMIICYDMTSSFLRANRDFMMRSRGMVNLLEEEEGILQSECHKIELQARQLELTNHKLVTEVRNRISTERKLSSSNEQLAQFSYAASHDLKEPLRSISSFIQLIRRKVNGMEDVAINEHTSVVIESASGMSNLLDNLLLYSRSGNPGRTSSPIDLNQLVNVVALKFETSLAELEVELNVEELPIVIADRVNVELLLAQLFKNSIQFRATDRTLSLRIYAQKGADGMVSIFFSDNGTGIEVGQTANVFRLFNRSAGVDDKMGSGVGLSIAKKIVHSSGGEIEFLETEGQLGATCRFTLPLLSTSDF